MVHPLNTSRGGLAPGGRRRRWWGVTTLPEDEDWINVSDRGVAEPVRQPERIELLQHLGSNRAFDHCAPEFIAAVKDELEVVRFGATRTSKAGRVLFAPALGEWHEVFVLEGVMKRVWLRSEGTEFISRFTGPGDYDTLWCEWLMRREVLHWMVAATDCTVAHIPSGRFAQLIKPYPEARADYEWAAMLRLEADAEHATHALMSTGDAKLRQLDDPALATLPGVTRKDLAAHLGIAAETLSRIDPPRQSPRTASLRRSLEMSADDLQDLLRE